MDDPVLEARSIIERFKLNDKVALVTGGGQGIGRAIAHALGEAGAAVAIVDINIERANSVVKELIEKKIDAIAIKADVTKKDQVNAMIDAIMNKWGKLTIAVNNAGICIWGDAEEMPEDIWEKQMDLNLKGTFLCAQAEGKVMLKAGYGKIINIASMSGHIVNFPQHQSAYNTSKAGVLHFTRSLAVEWAKKGICVNSISPGYTRTKLVADLLEKPEGKEVLPIWMNMTPRGKMVEVTDLQGAAVYLACEASDFMTGNDLIIDGGYCSF
jgi:NAD(P)-dependent dehydrogenase (short-subunit alcohol dehydrogenase family)